MKQRADRPAEPQARRSAIERWALGACVAACASVPCTWPAADARAQPLDWLELRWEAPAGCSTEEQVTARVRERLLALGLDHSERVRAEARVLPAGNAHRLELSLWRGEHSAHRQVALESCTSAADVTALLLVLALSPAGVEAPPAPDGDRASDPAAPTQAAGADTSPVPVSGVAEQTDREPDAPRDASHTPAREQAGRTPRRPAAAEAASVPLSLGGAFGVALVLDVGMLPNLPVWGLRPWAALWLDRLYGRAACVRWFPAHGAGSARLDAGVEGEGIAGELSLGAELLRAPVSLVPYAAIELARLSVATSGISHPGAASATWVAAGPGLLLSYGLAAGLELTFELAGVFPLLRPRWWVHGDAGDAVLLPAPSAALRISAGMAYGFR